MLTTPVISSTPLHAARLHARAPAGLEPQIAPEADRLSRRAERARTERVVAGEAAERAALAGLARPPEQAGAARPGSGPVGGAASAPLRNGDRAPHGGRLAGAPPGQAGSRPPGAPLSEAELAEIAELARRDKAVRAHEQAHARAGGRHAGAPRYDYATGPDGRRYAVSGRVWIDVSTEPSDPAATIEKMRTVKRAALAPADPSAADRRVAALAERLCRAAEADLAAMKSAERSVVAALETERLTRLAALFSRTAALDAAAEPARPAAGSGA
jgi:hypothetical protein